MENTVEVAQKEEFLKALQGMQGAGADAESEQSDLLHKYGSAVDRDVAVAPSQEGANFIVKFLQTIPGFDLSERVKNTVSDRKNVVASSQAVRADILKESSKTWAEVGINFGDLEGKFRHVDFRRVTDLKGLELRLNFDLKANFLGGVISDDEWFDQSGRTTRGSLKIDKDGTVLETKGSLEGIKKGKVNIPQLIHKMTSEEGLGEKIDPTTFIEIQ